MVKLYCPKCPGFDGVIHSTQQSLTKVASYEWCRKHLEGLEECNNVISMPSDLFLALIRKAYVDGYDGAQNMHRAQNYAYSIDIRGDVASELEKLKLI